jgi:serine/threonine protein phosphatase 1
MEDAEIPNGNTRLYVIGDIHGRLDLLERVIAAIARDVKEHGSDALTVTLGDYIDRGPASSVASATIHFRHLMSR